MIEEIRKFIENDEIQEALEVLENLVYEGKKKIEISIFKSRLTELNRKSRLGLLSNADENIERNKLRNGILELLSEISNSELQKEIQLSDLNILNNKYFIESKNEEEITIKPKSKK